MVAVASVQLSRSDICVNAVAPALPAPPSSRVPIRSKKSGEFKLSQTAEEVEIVKKQHGKFFEDASLLANPQYYYNRTQEAERLPMWPFSLLVIWPRR
jgi:hypothetical protein